MFQGNLEKGIARKIYSPSQRFRGVGGMREKGEGEKEGRGTFASDRTQYGGQQGVDTTWPRLWTKIFNTT